uniref:Uncharacterized protein n=1 Tax=Rhipicephalus microplus TaxID=6941 RepID=A0A6G5AHT1_RHIMP
MYNLENLIFACCIYTSVWYQRCHISFMYSFKYVAMWKSTGCVEEPATWLLQVKQSTLEQMTIDKIIFNQFLYHLQNIGIECGHSLILAELSASTVSLKLKI